MSSSYVLPVMEESVLPVVFHGLSVFQTPIAGVWELVLGEWLQVLQRDHPVVGASRALAATRLALASIAAI